MNPAPPVTSTRDGLDGCRVDAAACISNGSSHAFSAAPLPTHRGGFITVQDAGAAISGVP